MLKFGGYPIVIKELPDGDYLITCKGVTGKLSEIKEWLKYRSRVNKLYYFGKSKIRSIYQGKVTIDCLTEDISNVKQLINQLENKNHEESI